MASENLSVTEQTALKINDVNIIRIHHKFALKIVLGADIPIKFDTQDAFSSVIESFGMMKVDDDRLVFVDYYGEYFASDCIVQWLFQEEFQMRALKVFLGSLIEPKYFMVRMFLDRALGRKFMSG